MHKLPILVCYDYGTGGLWAVMAAAGPDQIRAKYPWLKVFTERPTWMSEAEYADLAANAAFDIDQPLSGWLLTAARERENA